MGSLILKKKDRNNSAKGNTRLDATKNAENDSTIRKGIKFHSRNVELKTWLSKVTILYDADHQGGISVSSGNDEKGGKMD